MSAEKTESEPLGAVLMNGVGAAAGRESPGMGVSGSKPLVNGELREAAGDGSGDGEFAAVKTSADSSASSAHEEVAVKVRGVCVGDCTQCVGCSVCEG